VNDAVQTAIIISFFGFLFTGLVSICVFFGIRLIKTIDKLTNVVERMDKQILQVDVDLNAHAVVLEAHAKQISHLAAKRCGDENCPLFDPDATPIPRLARTRVGDKEDSE
jgi:hypothetical protein